MTHYIVLRSDLPTGVKLAQCTHAAGESFGEPPRCRGEPIYAVVLSAKDERQLIKLEEKLSAGGVDFVSVREPDPPWSGQLMAIGLKPVNRNKVKKYLKNLPLIK